MTTDLISWTPIAGIVAFLVALFGVYRVLVSQKDATIETLREKNQFLSDQVQQMKDKSPDALFESVLRRYEAAEAEIKRRDVDDAERNRLLAQARRETQGELDDTLQRVEARLHELRASLDDMEQEQTRRTGG